MEFDDNEYLITGHTYKLNTVEINKINRSKYRTGTDFEEDIVEVNGKNCQNHTSGYCFIVL